MYVISNGQGQYLKDLLVSAATWTTDPEKAYLMTDLPTAETVFENLVLVHEIDDTTLTILDQEAISNELRNEKVWYGTVEVLPADPPGTVFDGLVITPVFSGVLESPDEAEKDPTTASAE